MKKTSVLLTAILLSGCSVAMSAGGKEAPDYSKLTQGTPKKEVDEILGKPVGYQMHAENGKIYTYEVKYKKGSPGRAAAHLGLNVLTLGLWEVVGTTVEAVNHDKIQVAAQFDAEDKLQSLSSGKDMAYEQQKMEIGRNMAVANQQYQQNLQQQQLLQQQIQASQPKTTNCRNTQFGMQCTTW